MKIVVDSNILIPALIKDSFIREKIVNFEGELFLPEVSLTEVENHKLELLEKSDLSEDEFDILLTNLLKYFTMVPTEKALLFKKEAELIIGHIDEDDVPFFAASLALHNCPIWSDDRHFKQQNKIRIYTTNELVNEFFNDKEKQL